MVLQDLFEGLESPAVEAKRLMREWRDLAAGKYELTIDASGTNASNAFPVVRKAGTWYGGVFIPKGGEKTEGARMLGVNHRARAFLKALAASLEQFIADGREVRLSDEDYGNRNSTYYQEVPPVRAGDVHAQLLKTVAEKDYWASGARGAAGAIVKRLHVYWWVSADQGKLDVTTVNFHATHGVGDEPAKHTYFLISLPKLEARTLASKIIEFKKSEPGKFALLVKQLVAKMDPDVELNVNSLFSLNVTLGNASNFFKRAEPAEVMGILDKFIK